ncbi:MAG: SemiSWEET transporter [Bacteroidota bacterium]
MSSLQLLGFAAAFCTTAAFLPQAIKTIRSKATHAISLPMYLLLIVGIILWLSYGLILGDYPIIIANAITLFLCSIILILKIKYG